MVGAKGEGGGDARLEPPSDVAVISLSPVYLELPFVDLPCVNLPVASVYRASPTVIRSPRSDAPPLSSHSDVASVYPLNAVLRPPLAHMRCCSSHDCPWPGSCGGTNGEGPADGGPMRVCQTGNVMPSGLLSIAGDVIQVDQAFQPRYNFVMCLVGKGPPHPSLAPCPPPYTASWPDPGREEEERSRLGGGLLACIVAVVERVECAM